MSGLIALTAVTGNTATVDLTALTGGTSSAVSILGYTGADWLRQDQYNAKTKLNGNGQLEYTMANGTVVGSVIGEYNRATFLTRDYDQNADETDLSTFTPGPDTFTAINFPTGGTLTFSPVSDQGTRQLFLCAGWFGSFTITAHLRDGSAADQTVTLSSLSGNRDIHCTWSGVDIPNNIDFTITGTGSGTNIMHLLYMYIPIPIAATIPRGSGKSRLFGAFGF